MKLQVGEKITFERTFTREDVVLFTEVSKDAVNKTTSSLVKVLSKVIFSPTCNFIDPPPQKHL
jgi:hypothetical protein